MPFDPDKEYNRLSRLLNAADRLKRELGDSATLDDATDRRRYHEEKAESIYDTYVAPLREQDDLSDLELRHLEKKETQMENHADKSSQFQRDIDALTTGSAADFTTPLLEICETIKREKRRLSRYKQAA
jgi:hypothetical protein